MKLSKWQSLVVMLAAGTLAGLAQAQVKPGTWEVSSVSTTVRGARVSDPVEPQKVCFERSEPPGITDDFIAVHKMTQCKSDGVKAAGAGKWRVEGACASGGRSLFELTVESRERMRVHSATSDNAGKPLATQDSLARWVANGCATGARRAGNFD